MNIMKPIKGEEWIEEMRKEEFWIEKKRSYPEKLYSRLTRSYVGWWCYFRLYSIWHRLTLLVDPLSSGGLYSHVRCFLFNVVVVDIWWRLKHRVWRLFHHKEWEQTVRFMDASMKAFEEGYADPMRPPFPEWEGKFEGMMLGERYFKRVAEILNDTEKESVKGERV